MYVTSTVHIVIAERISLRQLIQVNISANVYVVVSRFRNVISHAQFTEISRMDLGI